MKSHFVSLPQETRRTASSICAEATRLRSLSDLASGAMAPHVARVTLARLRELIDNLDADLAAQGFEVPARA